MIIFDDTLPQTTTHASHDAIANPDIQMIVGIVPPISQFLSGTRCVQGIFIGGLQAWILQIVSEKVRQHIWAEIVDLLFFLAWKIFMIELHLSVAAPHLHNALINHE